MTQPLSMFIIALSLALAIWPKSTAQTVAAASVADKPSAAIAYPTTPTLKPDRTRWRIGYVESGLYEQYPAMLRAVIEGLRQLGWVDLPEPMPRDATGESLWQWLGQHSRSDYVEFVSDAYWRPGNFVSRLRPVMREHIQTRIAQKHDIDLLLAMGTWAGLDLRTIGPPVSTVVAAASAPLESGIIDSIDDSGKDNLYASVEPRRYQRQLRLFHYIVPFKNLGIVYENSDAGRTYAALDDAREAGAELGFDIISCHAPSTSISAEQAMHNAVDCYQKLADQQVEAVYITSHQGVTQTSIVDIAHILRRAGIPSFSMQGSGDVEKGILLSMAQASLSHEGLLQAKAIARIFNGALPRQLNLAHMDPTTVALNMTTARIIGFDPPLEILLVADEIHDSPNGKQ